MAKLKKQKPAPQIIRIDMSIWCTFAQKAKQWKVSRQHVSQLAGRGKITCWRIPELNNLALTRIDEENPSLSE